ncbi:MAG TPA: hypothetical protein VGC06_21115 [Actinomycetes bacterium]
MNVTDVIFERPDDPPDPAYVLRVSIVGTGLTRSGPQLVAQVGDIPVRDLISLFEQEGVVGFLEAEPPVGAAVRVGYLGKEMIDSGQSYQPPNV